MGFGGGGERCKGRGEREDLSRHGLVPPMALVHLPFLLDVYAGASAGECGNLRIADYWARNLMGRTDFHISFTFLIGSFFFFFFFFLIII
jgi:hypothetical protein